MAQPVQNSAISVLQGTSFIYKLILCIYLGQKMNIFLKFVACHFYSSCMPFQENQLHKRNMSHTHQMFLCTSKSEISTRIVTPQWSTNKSDKSRVTIVTAIVSRLFIIVPHDLLPKSQKTIASKMVENTLPHWPFQIVFRCHSAMCVLGQKQWSWRTNMNSLVSFASFEKFLFKLL